MQDPLDTATIDLFKSKRGRPRKYRSNAEKQKAYRDRKRQLKDIGLDNGSVAKFSE